MQKFTIYLVSFILLSFFTLSADVFITELADPDNDAGARFVELFNNGASDVDLSTGWALQRWTNNYADPQDSVLLTGTIPAGGFYIVSPNSTEFETVYGFAPDQDIGINGPADSNGDDQIALLDASKTIVDIFGVPGEDGTDTKHEFEDGRAERVGTVTTGNVTWDDAEWTTWCDGPTGGDYQVAQNAPGDFDPGIWIGSGADNPPSISFLSASPKVPAAAENTTVSANVTDDSGLTLVELRYTVNGGSRIDVTMSVTSGDTYGADIPSSAYVDGDSVEYWVYAEDDATVPQSNESSHVKFFVGTMNIADIKAVDADGVMLYDGIYAKIVGVATVANGTFSSSYLDVYVQDATGGINIYLSGGASTTVTIGNEYTIVGALEQYNGKGELIPDGPDDITDGGASTVPDATVITIDNLMIDPEAYEGMLVQILDADYVSGTWPSSITLNDGGTQDLVMYIDSDTDIDESLEGDYPLDVTGIFSQYDGSSPYTSGYQILPRSVTDLNWGSSAIERMDNSAMVTEFKLHGNFPNPFNPSTTLQFDVPKQVDNLNLSIYNTAGQKIATLYNGSVAQGTYQYTWHGVNQTNQEVPSGVYFAVLKTVDFTQSIKMMLIK